MICGANEKVQKDVPYQKMRQKEHALSPVHEAKAPARVTTRQGLDKPTHFDASIVENCVLASPAHHPLARPALSPTPRSYAAEVLFFARDSTPGAKATPALLRAATPPPPARHPVFLLGRSLGTAREAPPRYLSFLTTQTFLGTQQSAMRNRWPPQEEG